MTREKHLENFTTLGNELAENYLPEEIIHQAKAKNGWFTEKSIAESVEGIRYYLEETNLQQWMDNYPAHAINSKLVGVIMAGNIPLVGFHDLMSVLISGHKINIKMSSLDEVLIAHLVQRLVDIDHEYKDLIYFDKSFKEIEALIATGSNNSARYFKYYFKHIPALIRKNRSSLAILKGDETPEKLFLLGKDILSYYGLGCRNVSQMYIPLGYELNQFFEAVYPYHDIIDHHKYANNYQYYHTIYLLNKVKFLENGFLIVKEDSNIYSPVSVLNFSYYDSILQLQGTINSKSEEIQCIVGEMDPMCNVAFGASQKPAPWDYADQVDTMNFLLKI